MWPRMNTTVVRNILALTLALVPAAGCVPTQRYDDAMARLDTERGFLQQARAKAAAERASCQEVAERDAAAIHELWAKLEQSGMSKEQLLAEKGALALSLEATKIKLAALRHAQRVAEERAAVYRDVAAKLKSMIDAGEVQVVFRDGRMVIVLPTDVLFDSGRVEIKPAAREGLSRIAAVLKTLEKRHLQVAGHTDTVPISTPRFPSNWELSAGRALVVSNLLIEAGVLPEVISAAAYGQFDPVGDNATPEGRAKNRRIEITLMPEIDQPVSLPQ
jgi:chemotaxis protein MotB